MNRRTFIGTIAALLILVSSVHGQSRTRTYRIIDGVEAGVATKEEAAQGFVSLKCVAGDCQESLYRVFPPDVLTWHGCKDVDIRVERDADGIWRFGKQSEGCVISEVTSEAETPKCTPIELAILHCGLRLPVQSPAPCRP